MNKPFIANIIFNDKSTLEKINAIVHPRVAEHFDTWALKQNATYVLKVVAILFVNDGHKACDVVITVRAPKDIKINRLLERDNTSKSKIEAIMKNQWSDDEKVRLSDFVIENKDLETTKYQVIKVHNQLLKKFQ